MEASLTRAYELYRLHKYSTMLEEVDSFLSREPENARAYALKSLAYLGKKETKGALENAQKAVSLGPEDQFHHYVLSLVHLNLTKDYKKAELSIDEALRINPAEAIYYDILAQLKMVKREFKESLQIIDKGLELDPHNAACLSTRALVLTKIGKNKDANDDLNEALMKDPENFQTLASAGWVRLENGDQKGALEAFRDALKIKPDYEYARDGLIQALKARNFVFRQYLKYVFWISKLGKGLMWGLVIGVYVLVRLIALLPAMKPILILYILFVLSTWLINPIFNLFLRFDRYGKYALTKSEIMASNLVVTSIFLAIAVAVVSLIINLPLLLPGALALFLLVIPISGTASFFPGSSGKYRKALWFTIVLAAIMLAGFALFLFIPGAAVALFAITIIGSVIFSWIAGLMR
jgi:Tfp pilus assembly protein PilF